MTLTTKDERFQENQNIQPPIQLCTVKSPEECKSLQIHGNEKRCFAKSSSREVDLHSTTSDEERKESASDKLLRKCSVNKPLLQLKISLFLFFGAGASIAPFLQVYFKQRGLTISQLSVIYIVNPSVQFLGPAISGLIADKTGKSKPVLLANMALATFFLTGMLFIPDINKRECSARDILLRCSEGLTVTNLNTCHPAFISARLHKCGYHCDDNNTSSDLQYLCSHSERKLCVGGLPQLNPSEMNFTLVQNVFETDDPNNCSYDVIGQLSDGTNQSLCKINGPRDCILKCVLYYIQDKPVNNTCQLKEDNGTFVFVVSFILMIFFSTVLSNCYRFMDVTAMSLVKMHDSDFGRQRFWSILSVLLLSPLAGYLVSITSLEGGPKNCSTAFYMFDVLMVLAMVSVWKLDVRIKPPGERMWKKSLMLMKNPEVIAFTATLVVLGTSWGFTKMFSYLYLDQLHASSLLLGIIPSVNSLVGLPFLLTSNWWVRKMGSVNLLLLGLVAYIVFCTGYSFLLNPWYSVLFEICSIFSYHLLWVAVIRHCHEISPEGLTTTVIALAGGIHYAIGKGSGSLIGGQIMAEFGGRSAYRVIASICGVTSCLYGVFICFRSRRSKTCRIEDVPKISPTEVLALPEESVNMR